ncbi:hypothetical protein ACTA71_010985 [Dictyostelium dimigraforme]
MKNYRNVFSLSIKCIETMKDDLDNLFNWFKRSRKKLDNQHVQLRSIRWLIHFKMCTLDGTGDDGIISHKDIGGNNYISEDEDIQMRMIMERMDLGSKYKEVSKVFGCIDAGLGFGNDYCYDFDEDLEF